jgi:phosphoglycerol transferase MdoB-like AlkP superfamily enzyme
MEDPFISSAYSGNEIHGLAEELRSQGYAAHFFHGAKDVSLFIDSRARIVGFDHYHGMAQYPDNARDYDGDWGIADEPVLQYMASRLSAIPQPFVAGIFTLSAHNPFTIPKQYRGHFSTGTNPIDESLGYSDYALQRFFQTAAQTALVSQHALRADRRSLGQHTGQALPDGNGSVPGSTAVLSPGWETTRHAFPANHTARGHHAERA